MIKPKKRARKPIPVMKLMKRKTAFHDEQPWVDVSALPWLDAKDCLKLAVWLARAAAYLRGREK